MSAQRGGAMEHRNLTVCDRAKPKHSWRVSKIAGDRECRRGGSDRARFPVVMGARERKPKQLLRAKRDLVEVKVAKNNIGNRSLRLLLAGCIAALSSLALAPAAGAETPQPHWTIATSSAPTYFQGGDEGDYYEVIAVNDGGGATDGSPITMALTLPPGVTATAIRGDTRTGAFGGVSPMQCTTAPVACEAGGAIRPEEILRMKVIVTVPGDASGTLTDTATISGGGAQAAQATGSTPISSEPVPYGATATTSLIGEGGTAATQAGSHPYGFTTILAFNVGSVGKLDKCDPEPRSYGCAVPNANAKDVDVALPPALVGNPLALPRCKQAVFQEPQEYGTNCPADTQVGTLQVSFYGNTTAIQGIPLYNVEPPPGQPAELGFTIAGFFHIPIFFRLRSDGDYGLTARLKSITEADPVQTVVLTTWGVPAAAGHDGQRYGFPGCPHGCESDVAPQPFLSLPTSCSGEELPVPFSGDSWQNPLDTFPVFGTTHLPAVTGCNQLDFKPSLEARPTTNVADSPSGLKVDVHVPQDHSGPEGGENPEGLATAHLKEAKVTLPKGLTVNPSAAAGLEGCTPAQVGLTSGLGATPIHMSADPANCPDGSKLGSVEVDTQLIDHPLPGAVYLAKPYDNPFKSLLALYITVNDPKTSTVVKLAGKVEVGADGQLTTTVSESPQLPFEDFKLDFFGGARAPLRTPATCGEYETTSELTPWSAPESGPPAKRSDAYPMEVGPNGHACPHTEAQQPNSPTFEAGTESPIAGAFSPFSLHLHREDGSQVFKALNVSLPPGLIGKLAGVGECSDAQLATAAGKSGAEEQASPSCPAASRLGTVSVGAGAGPSPYYVGGTAYLAGPYKGAPLSVAIITPAVAGPFDLGTVVVRSALYVNSETAQISVVSDPIPTILQGIPLDVRAIDVNLDRNQFTLNPTNCERMAVAGERALLARQHRHPDQPLPGRRMPQARLQAETLLEALRQDQAHRPPGVEGGPHDASARPKNSTLRKESWLSFRDPATGQHRSRPGHPAPLRVPRPGPHRHRLHQGPVQRRRRQRRTVSRRLDLRPRPRDHAIARQPDRRPGLPALLQPQAPRPGRRPERSDLGRSGRQGRHRQGRRDPQHLRSRARRPGLQVRPLAQGRKQGPPGQLGKHLPQAPARDRRLHGPKRQGERYDAADFE